MYITRLRLAFLVAPFFPTLYFLVMPYLTNTAYTGRYDIVLVLLFSLPISYISCFLLCRLLISFLKKIRQLNIVSFSFGGAAIGLVVFYIFGFGFAAFLNSSRNIMPNIEELLFGALFGVLIALPFGFIAGFPFFSKP